MAFTNSNTPNYGIFMSADNIAADVPPPPPGHPQRTLLVANQVTFVVRLTQTRVLADSPNAVLLQRQKTLESLAFAHDGEPLTSHVSKMLSDLRQASDGILSVSLSRERRRLYWNHFRVASARPVPVKFEAAVGAIAAKAADAMSRSGAGFGPCCIRMLVTIEKRFGLSEDLVQQYNSRIPGIGLGWMSADGGSSADVRSMQMRSMARLLAQLPPPRQSTLSADVAVESLERVESWEEGLECAICLEKASAGERVRFLRMPCSHVFHGNCILRWLNRKHTCPVCRFALPTNREVVIYGLL